MAGVIVAGVEGGGTSWRAALGRISPDRKSYELLEDHRWMTTSPAETLGAINAWLRERRPQFQALGIASFGPVDPKRGSPTFGYITATPKVAWRNTDVVTALTAGLGADLACAFDTDVNAPALAEYMLSGMAEQSKSSCAYVTVGTGVGVGLVVNGKTVHGLLHPEAGHISVPLMPADADSGLQTAFSLTCPGWVEVESMSAKKSLEQRILAAEGKVRALWRGT
jgi:fructokinase